MYLVVLRDDRDSAYYSRATDDELGNAGRLRILHDQLYLYTDYC